MNFGIMVSMDPINLFGAFGALLILIAFIMNQLHKWKDEYLIYDLFNFIGSLILIVYAILLRSYPFLILNGVWAAVSMRDIFKDLQRNSGRESHSFFKKWLQ